jgi:hypothetical protein
MIIDCFACSSKKTPRRDKTTLSLRGFSQRNSGEAISKLEETDCFACSSIPKAFGTQRQKFEEKNEIWRKK